MTRAAALALLVLLGGCMHRPASAPATVALDRLLAFADPARCQPSETHAALLRAMIAGDANEGFRAGRIAAPPAFRSAFGPVEVRRHAHHWTIAAPVRGTLWGLPLVRIAHDLPEGGDAGGLTYVFRAPVDRLGAALSARGFPAREGQEVVLGPPDGLEHVMLLKTDPDDPALSLFGCDFR